MKLQSNIKVELTRINFIYKNQPVLTECIAPYKGFTLFNKQFGPFKKGKTYKLKFWLALPLIAHNILKIAPGEKCDNVDVQRFAIRERDDPQLAQLENNLFLNKIKEFRNFMIKITEEGIKPKQLMDLYNSYTANIIDTRLLKLLRLSQTELTEITMSRLSTSEKVLYKELFEIVGSFRDFFLD
ncbi:MAG: hypothetical protein BAJALOKI1v1_200014 [Promethearchaeota archaeon]|nr:MAG: hypothetical protein BAJALOKI1v1_200014 [Candidatus Lokiarchaeota archaeon]